MEVLTEEVKQTILKCYKDWISSGDRTVVAIAYRPIDESFRALFPSDTEAGPIAIFFEKHPNREKKRRFVLTRSDNILEQISPYTPKFQMKKSKRGTNN